MKTVRGLVVLALGATLGVAAAGCSSTSSPATPPEPTTVQVTETLAGPLPARAWSCMSVSTSASTPIDARVSPEGLFLEVRQASCGSEGTLLFASDTGQLLVQLPAGEKSVRVGNPTDQETSFSLQIRYNR
jgi:hypothetical protein